MLTETRFKEIYDQAERLRAVGGYAAAGELLLFLFDHGRDVGGYGAVRLSFVLRDLAELADLANPRPDPTAQRIRHGLEARRDERERLASRGDAGFTEVQELLALNRALGQPQRSFDLYQGLQAPSREHAEIAAVRKVLAGLMLEEILPGDAEKIAEQFAYEQLKRRLLELDREVATELAAAAPQEGEARRIAAEIKALCDPHRIAGEKDLPRSEQEKRRLAELARDTAALLERHALLTAAPAGEEIRDRLPRLARELRELIARHEIRADLLRDADIREQLVRLARGVAGLIAESRIAEDFALADARPLAEIQDALAARIRHDGLLAYEALLRIGEDAAAERTGSWLLAFRQDEETYSSLVTAARRARKPKIESRLQEEAQRLLIG
ncbi:MAG TPA: hypothetical protein VIH93_00135 [Thermoanaerobaculia bacterium]